mmetsp:Transcript_39241/g.89144  ORF Transcript_39241/g.89144 Transcript_39241/m.89144 type:complete len:308 (-) Transcript_39241:1112-2035(-)
MLISFIFLMASFAEAHQKLMNVGSLAHSCPVCGAASHHQTVVFHHALDFRDRHMHQCGMCTSVYVWPLPTDQELSGLYVGDKYYKSRGGRRAATQFPLLPSSQAQWIQQRASGAWTERARPVFVDVGCGAGFLLSKLWSLSPREGIQMICYEPSKEVAEDARHTFKTHAAGSSYIVHPTLFDGCGHEQAGKITLITMSHVLEHLASPHSMLRTLAKCLMPRGYAFLAVPNKPLRGEASSTLEQEVNTQGTRGVSSTGDFKPKNNFHLFYFTEKSIRALIYSGHNATFSIIDTFSNSKEVRVLLRRRM